MYTGHCVKYLLFLPCCGETRNVARDFGNVIRYQILPVGAGLFRTDGRTDRQEIRSYAFLRTSLKPHPSWAVVGTVEPRITNAPVHEQFGSRTNFPKKNVSDDERCLGLRTRKLATAAS
jgi:hypothetical protein